MGGEVFFKGMNVEFMLGTKGLFSEGKAYLDWEDEYDGWLTLLSTPAKPGTMYLYVHEATVEIESYKLVSGNWRVKLIIRPGDLT